MMPITNPDIRAYLASVTPERESKLEALYQEATTNNIPIIKHEMEDFLRLMVVMNQPKRILEIGTAIGYSSIIMSLAIDPPPQITTLEKSEKMLQEARTNIKKFDLEKSITIIQGDAVEVLKDLKEPFDMIFMDAAKGQYMNFYEDVMRLLEEGGILVADNVLQDGLVAKSRYAVPRRQRTIHSRMREFLKTLSYNEALTTSILPIADGATVSVRKRSKNE
ncbi:O-methyltransferase [Petrocella sp. FN5]|uniref:O-methyltransferase n=1 Tax=Petrocella sp. FN5 TaxID=3032002 RepID=UPI0023D9C96A|nr:O-methyltransferase [Petrocella sp. FN5]MDF1617036.1 O-methyltransferase [Petrocella sp. FN5]